MLDPNWGPPSLETIFQGFRTEGLRREVGFGSGFELVVSGLPMAFGLGSAF